MLAAYRRVFTYPGALAFSATGLVARLPIAMMTLGIVLLVSTLSGSYSLAGQVSAAYIVGNAAFAVPHGRLADRFGQARVLYADALVFSLTSGLMILAVTDRWGTPWPHLLAALSGASISQIGSMVRARWAHLLDSAAERHTAFAVEGVVDEMVFVAGPAIVTFLSTLHAPQSGLVVAVVLGAGGALALAVQRRTEPPAHPPQPGAVRAALPWAVLVPLTVGAVALGCLFGSLEVAAVAAADDEGRKAFSGVLLAAFALGSGIAALFAGAIAWRRTPVQRARIGMWLLAAGTLVVPVLPGLGLLTAALFLTGLALAPTLIALFSIIETATPRARLNEAMGIVQTGVAAGIAPGAWLAGVTADHVSGSAAFWIGAGAAILAATSGFFLPEVGRPRAWTVDGVVESGS